jgi:hypothetical protein
MILAILNGVITLIERLVERDVDIERELRSLETRVGALETAAQGAAA